jgi:DNA invertase Pin-like site-specific DNA recombinase
MESSRGGRRARGVPPGKSGLGLAAQREAVKSFLDGGNWTFAAEFTEVESGKRSDRPELAKALHACRVYGARLVIAKLDRLSRDAHFLLGLEKAGVDFVAADMPMANRLTVGIMAMVADDERRMISVRTKAALAAAKSSPSHARKSASSIKSPQPMVDVRKLSMLFKDCFANKD